MLFRSKLTAGDGTIGGILKSANYVSGVSGWAVHPTGWAEFANATVRGTVYADTGWFKGQIIGGSATTYDSGTGMWTGVDAETWKFRLGSSASYLRWDGASLTLRGTLTIEDGSGNVLLSSGTGVPWDRISGTGKPSDGATRNVFRGDWTASTPYAVGDIVLKDGNGWSCVLSHTSASDNQPPTSGSGNDWWALYAVKGSDGAQGLHALTVLVPNNAHTLPAASDGAVSSYVGSGTAIQVFEGATALSAVSSITANGQFTIGAPTQVPASTITVGARSYADTTATVAQHSAMAAGTDSVVVTYPITVRRTDGTTVTLSATQTLTKSKAGAKGDAGESAKAAFLAATSQVFQIAKNGTITPSSITLTATGQNVTGSPTFSVTSGTATLTGTGNTRTLASTGLTTDAATIKITWDGQEDYVTVVKVREGADGTSGANAIVAVLSNEAHTVPTDSTGNNGVFTGANTTMTIYNGTADDSANWTVTATVSNVTGSLSGKTYTVTGLSADTGYVDLTAARSGYASIVKRFVLTKSKAGVTGAQGPAGPAVVVTANRALSFTATDGALDGSQADIVLTAAVSGITSPTYAWTFSGLQTNPTASTTSSQTITAAQFGTSKSATVTCTVKGTHVDQVTIVRLEKSTAEAGATVGATAAQAAELQSLAKSGANLVANAAFASTIGGSMCPGWTLYNNAGIANVQWWYRGGGMFGTDAQRVKTLAATTNTFGVRTNFSLGGGVRYVPGWGHYISFYARAVSGEPGFAGLTMSGTASNNLWTSIQVIENPPLLNDVYQRYVFYGVANAGADLTAGWLWITANGSKPANASLDICCVQVEAAVSGAVTAWKPGYYDVVGAGRPITPSNVTTYIASAAIGNAQIGGDIYSSNWSGWGGAGWLLDRGGNFYGNNIYARGDIQASSLKANTAMIEKAHLHLASVGTLQIAENAVTIPVHAYTSASLTLNSIDVYVDIQSAYVDPEGGSVSVVATFQTTQGETHARVLDPSGSVLCSVNNTGGCISLSAKSNLAGTYKLQAARSTPVNEAMAIVAQRSLLLIGSKR